MRPRQPVFIATLFCPTLQTHAEVLPQDYDYSYQLYQEGSDRIRVESSYIRGQIEIDDATSFRFQWLHDAISGSSPTGALPGGAQPFLSELDEVRIGILGAISRQFGDHLVEFELSYSDENDYTSRGLALTDSWDLNLKNTTVSYGINFLNDDVRVAGLGTHDKKSYDLFTGVSQIIDKDTIVSANLTLGYAEGYLNDQYKYVQRNEITSVPDGTGGTIEIPVVNLYRENRPDHRFRQVLQLQGIHYFESADAALDAVVRLSTDDFGIFSQTVQIEWRQSVGDRFQVVPFFRFYHQSAADFFVNTLDNVNIATPSPDPDGSTPNYSADYRLSAMDTVSGGLRLLYQFNDTFAATAAYERYVMRADGNAQDTSPDQAYPAADIWTFGVSATF